MTEKFTECFVDHRNVSLAAKAISELALHHAKRGFNVTAFVIARKKIRPLKLEVVIHLFPRPTAIPAMMRSERNKRSGSESGDSLRVALAGVAFVGGDFGNLKVLSCAVLWARTGRTMESFVCRPSISTAVTMFVLTPHIRWHLTQSCCCLTWPYL